MATDRERTTEQNGTVATDGVTEDGRTTTASRRYRERVIEGATPTSVPVVPPGPNVNPQVVAPQPYPLVGANIPRDQVRWAAVLAGLVSAVTAFAMLALLSLAIGLTITPGGAPAGAAVRETGTWLGISAIIALLIGGFIAARSAAVFTRSAATLNGVMVFLVAVPIVLWLAGAGLGAAIGAFGPLGSFGGGLQFGPGAAQTAANGVRVSAWAALIGFTIGILASGIGGFLGARTGADFRDANGPIRR